MKKNPAATAATQAALQSAFWSLYQQKPTKEITVKEITDLAGYHRSTFYQYYRDVYDVMEQLQAQVFASIEAFSQLAVEEGETHSLLELAYIFLESQKNVQPCLIVLLMRETDPTFERRLVEWIKVLFQKLFNWENVDPLAQEFFTEYHIHGVLGAIKYTIRSGRQPTLEQLISSIALATGHTAEALTSAPFANQLQIALPKTVEKP